MDVLESGPFSLGEIAKDLLEGVLLQSEFIRGGGDAPMGEFIANVSNPDKSALDVLLGLLHSVGECMHPYSLSASCDKRDLLIFADPDVLEVCSPQSVCDFLGVESVTYRPTLHPDSASMWEEEGIFLFESNQSCGKLDLIVGLCSGDGNPRYSSLGASTGVREFCASACYDGSCALADDASFLKDISYLRCTNPVDSQGVVRKIRENL